MPSYDEHREYISEHAGDIPVLLEYVVQDNEILDNVLLVNQLVHQVFRSMHKCSFWFELTKYCAEQGKLDYVIQYLLILEESAKYMVFEELALPGQDVIPGLCYFFCADNAVSIDIITMLGVYLQECEQVSDAMLQALRFKLPPTFGPFKGGKSLLYYWASNENLRAKKALLGVIAQHYAQFEQSGIVDDLTATPSIGGYCAWALLAEKAGYPLNKKAVDAKLMHIEDLEEGIISEPQADEDPLYFVNEETLLADDDETWDSLFKLVCNEPTLLYRDTAIRNKVCSNTDNAQVFWFKLSYAASLNIKSCMTKFFRFICSDSDFLGFDITILTKTRFHLGVNTSALEQWITGCDCKHLSILLSFMIDTPVFTQHAAVLDALRAPKPFRQDSCMEYLHSCNEKGVSKKVVLLLLGSPELICVKGYAFLLDRFHRGDFIRAEIATLFVTRPYVFNSPPIVEVLRENYAAFFTLFDMIAKNKMSTGFICFMRAKYSLLESAGFIDLINEVRPQKTRSVWDCFNTGVACDESGLSEYLYRYDHADQIKTFCFDDVRLATDPAFVKGLGSEYEVFYNNIKGIYKDDTKVLSILYSIRDNYRALTASGMIALANKPAESVVSAYNSVGFNARGKMPPSSVSGLLLGQSRFTLTEEMIAWRIGCLQSSSPSKSLTR